MAGNYTDAIKGTVKPLPPMPKRPSAKPPNLLQRQRDSLRRSMAS